MKRKAYHDVWPFLSVVIFVSTLFGMVFLKMETRRMGYLVLKATQEYRKLQDQHRMLTMEYVKMTRSDRVRNYAVNRLTLGDARDGQIIQLTGRNLALPQ